MTKQKQPKTSVVSWAASWEKKITKEYKETFGCGGYIHNLDGSENFTVTFVDSHLHSSNLIKFAF